MKKNWWDDQHNSILVAEVMVWSFIQLFNLYEMSIYCESSEFVILREDTLLFEAVQSAQDSTYTLHKGPISIFDDFAAKRKVYYFASRWIYSIL